MGKYLIPEFQKSTEGVREPGRGLLHLVPSEVTGLAPSYAMYPEPAKCHRLQPRASCVALEDQNIRRSPFKDLRFSILYGVAYRSERAERCYKRLRSFPSPR